MDSQAVTQNRVRVTSAGWATSMRCMQCGVILSLCARFPGTITTRPIQSGPKSEAIIVSNFNRFTKFSLEDS